MSKAGRLPGDAKVAGQKTMTWMALPRRVLLPPLRDDKRQAYQISDEEKEEIVEHNMGSAVYTTPVAHDGVLYIASRSELFAIGG